MKKLQLPRYMTESFRRNIHRIFAGEEAEQVIAEIINVHPLMRRDIWSIAVGENSVSICRYINGNNHFWRVYRSVDEACAALNIIANGGVPSLKAEPADQGIISSYEEAAADDSSILSSLGTRCSTSWLSSEAQSLFFSDELYLATEIVQMTGLRGWPRLQRKIYVRLLGWLPIALRDRLGCR